MAGVRGTIGSHLVRNNSPHNGVLTYSSLQSDTPITLLRLYSVASLART
jgi:hypothetical protein